MGATRMSGIPSTRSSNPRSIADRHEKYVAVYAVHMGIIGVAVQNLSAGSFAVPSGGRQEGQTSITLPKPVASDREPL